MISCMLWTQWFTTWRSVTTQRDQKINLKGCKMIISRTLFIFLSLSFVIILFPPGGVHSGVEVRALCRQIKFLITKPIQPWTDVWLIATKNTFPLQPSPIVELTPLNPTLNIVHGYVWLARSCSTVENNFTSLLRTFCMPLLLPEVICSGVIQYEIFMHFSTCWLCSV